jgi:hypothetical protein
MHNGEPVKPLNPLQQLQDEALHKTR